MVEREHYVLATTAAEKMYQNWELQHQQEGLDLDAMMRRLKDLSAYSFTHAEIMEQRESVGLLALAIFFGATSNPAFHGNQKRLQLLSEENVAYEGQDEVIEQEVDGRNAARSGEKEERGDEPLQPCLL